jgi:3-methyladenine DNA glycosylase AlkD
MHPILLALLFCPTCTQMPGPRHTLSRRSSAGTRWHPGRAGRLASRCVHSKAMSVSEVRKRLRAVAEPERAAFLQGYFRTTERFLGARVPAIRKLAREYRSLSLADTLALLRSATHEERLLALLILGDAYDRADAMAREKIFRLYLANTRYINNWDLVDSSAAAIVGAHLTAGDRALLDVLAGSKDVWERRIAIIATHHFIKRGEYADTVRVATSLLADEHDLIHKATGWMLREMGKRDRTALHAFLDAHAAHMPRTMLRYAIERLPVALQRRYRNRTPDKKTLHE